MARPKKKTMLFNSTKDMIREKDDLVAEFLKNGGKVTVCEKVDPYKVVDTVTQDA